MLLTTVLVYDIENFESTLAEWPGFFPEAVAPTVAAMLEQLIEESAVDDRLREIARRIVEGAGGRP
jgi:dethiobiotin synthetase